MAGLNSVPTGGVLGMLGKRPRPMGFAQALFDRGNTTTPRVVPTERPAPVAIDPIRRPPRPARSTIAGGSTESSY